MRIRLVGIVFVLGVVAAGAAVAELNRNWSTHTNGSPPGGGRADGVLAEGTITAEDFIGPSRA